uniref:GRIP domain-containing protein n=1 Tax=Panagrellus redivivus TaxID=6233 RepID=A0A7E4VUX4_PANRE
MDNVRDLQKSLKDRTNEVETLKKKLEKAERDRRNAESRQPTNVQQLQSEKRELQIALEREESEKHELFMQINQLIAELADLRGNENVIADAKELRELNDQLRGKLSVIEGERDHFQKSYSTLEAGQQATRDELLATKSELERIKVTAESERQKFKQEIADHQKEVQIKSAALASLRLAKQEPSTSAEDYDKVVQEVAALKKDIAEKEKLIAAATASNDEIRQTVSKLEANLSALLTDKQNLESQLTEKHEEAKILRTELTSASSANAGEAVQMREKLDASENLISQLKNALELAQRNSNDVEIQASELEEKLAQAEDQVEKLSDELKRRESISSDFNSEKQKHLELRATLESTEKAKTAIENELQRRKSEISQGEARIAELEAKLEALSKENAKLMEKASVEEELVTLVSSLQETRSILSAKDAEIQELRKYIGDHQDESDKLAAQLREAQSNLQRAHENAESTESVRVEADQLRRELQETNDEFNRLVEDFQKAQKMLIDAEERVNRESSENAELRDSLLKAQNELRDAQTDIDRLNKQLERANAELKEAESKQTVEVELTKLKSELREVQTRADSLQSEVTKAENAKASAEEAVYLKVAEITKLQTENKKLSEELQSTQTDMEQLTSNFEKVRLAESSFHDEIVEVRGVAAQLRDELRDAHDRIEQLTSELHETQAALKTAQEAVAKSTADASEVVEIRAEVNRLREELLSSDAEIKRLKNELEETQKVDFKQRDLAEVAENRLEKLRLVEIEKNHLETRLREKQYELESLQKDLDKYVAKESAVAAQGEEAASEVKAALAAAEARLADLESELNQLRAREYAHADEVKKHSDAAKDAEMRLNLLQVERSSMEASIFEAQRKSSAVDSRIVELEGQLKEKESEFATLTQAGMEVDVLRSSLNDLHSRLEVTLEHKTALEAELRELKYNQEQAQQKEATLIGDLTAAQRAKLEYAEQLEAKQAEFTADLRKVQEEASENVRRLTDLLSAEAKRVETVVKEKEQLLIEKAELLEQLKSAPVNGNDDELQRKLSELTAENARLAGDLLKKESTASSNANTVELERNLLIKQREWSGERVKLEEQIGELQDQVGRLRSDKENLEGEVNRLKQISETLPPVPKPRRANTSLTNLTMDTLSERSITPNGDEEEVVRKLRSDLEKQKRLITVLRKKLQQQQLDSHRAAKLSTGSVPFFS